MSTGHSIEQQHFDERAAGYETDIGEEYPQWLKWYLLEKYSTAGDHCLDVGGANGRHSVILAQAGRRVGLVDLSPGMLQAMQNRLKNSQAGNAPEPVAADARHLPFADHQWNLSWSYATLLLIPDQKRAIAELVRVTKPGGYVILDIGMPWNIGWVYWRRFYKKRGFPGIFPMSRPALQELLDTADCQIIEDIPTGFLSQLLYIPFVERFTPLRRWIHSPGQRPDLDGRVSRWCRFFANRRYIVVQKGS